jgi:hypothetical protein
MKLIKNLTIRRAADGALELDEDGDRKGTLSTTFEDFVERFRPQDRPDVDLTIDFEDL